MDRGQRGGSTDRSMSSLGSKAVNGGRLRARFPTGFHRSNNFPSCGRNPGGLIYQKMAEGGGHAPQPEWLPTVWFSRPTRRFDDSPSIETRLFVLPLHQSTTDFSHCVNVGFEPTLFDLQVNICMFAVCVSFGKWWSMTESNRPLSYVTAPFYR